ncbi:hypothetical protein IWZ01DRAFT_340676 [Phyllosticta capitalensis]
MLWICVLPCALKTANQWIALVECEPEVIAINTSLLFWSGGRWLHKGTAHHLPKRPPSGNDDVARPVSQRKEEDLKKTKPISCRRGGQEQKTGKAFAPAYL